MTLLSGGAFADTCAGKPASNADKWLSPALQQALGELDADDFQTRTKALSHIEFALAQQMNMLLDTDGAPTPESESHVAELAQFNEGLSGWVLNVLHLPAAERKAQFTFGLKPDALPMITKIFSGNPATRIAGIRLLAKIPGAEADRLLSQLMIDRNRAVYLAAIEAAWDRPAAEPPITSLWRRAVSAEFDIAGAGNVPETSAVFRGKTLGGSVIDDSAISLATDGDVANDTLLHLHTPLVRSHLLAFIADVKRINADPTTQKAKAWMYSSFSEGMKHFCALVKDEHSQQVVDAFFDLAFSPLPVGEERKFGADFGYTSNRTLLLATCAQLLGAKPEDLGLRQIDFGSIWISPSEKDEAAILDKIKARRAQQVSTQAAASQ